MSNRVREALVNRAVSPITELGQTGLKRDLSGYISEEFLPNLQGHWQRIQVYREMKENDPIVGAALFAIDMVVREVPWWIKADDDSAEARQNQEFMIEAMEDMSHTWDDFIVEAMSAVPFGWAWFEIVYKRRRGENRRPSLSSRFTDDRMGWRKFAIRSQDTLDRWEFDENGGIVGMWQIPPPLYERVFIPMDKSVLFRASQSKGNPEGRSALRSAYRPWYFKRRIEEYEGIGVERDLAGIPRAYVDPSILAPDASDAEKATLLSIQEMLKNVRLDQQVGIILPALFEPNGSGNRLYEFDLISSPGTKQFQTETIIQRLDQRIAMTVLADFILLGHQQVGSFALASSRTNLFSHAVGAWVSSIEETLNRHVIPRLFRLNGIRTKIPKLQHRDVSTPDLAEVAAFIAQTAGAGMPWFPDEQLHQHIRNMAGMPEEPPGGMQILGPDGQPIPQGKPTEPGEKDEDRRRAPRRVGRKIPRGTPDTTSETQRGI